MIMIDVRTKKEYEIDHIPGAVLHDVMDMVEGVFPAVDKFEEITVYCQSGGRSAMAKTLLEKAGFINVTDAGSINNVRE